MRLTNQCHRRERELLAGMIREVYVDGQPVYQWMPPVGNTILDLCENIPGTEPKIDVASPFIPLR